MGKGAASVSIRQSPVDGLDDVEVVKHVVERAVIRELIQHVLDSLFSRHVGSLAGREEEEVEIGYPEDSPRVVRGHDNLGQGLHRSRHMTTQPNVPRFCCAASMVTRSASRKASAPDLLAYRDCSKRLLERAAAKVRHEVSRRDDRYRRLCRHREKICVA